MTQQATPTPTEPMNIGPPPAAAQQPMNDGLLQMFVELQRERKRIGQIADPTAKKLTMEIADTVMSYVEDLNGFVIQLRDWVGSSLGDVHERLLQVENFAEDFATPPGLSEEEANKITELAGAASALAQTALNNSPGATQEAKNALLAVIELAKEVIEIVADAEDGDEDSDGDTEDGGEPEATADGNGAGSA